MPRASDEQVLGPRPVRRRGQLGGQAEVGGEPASEVRAYRLARRRGPEHRPVFHEVGGRARIVVRPDVHPVLGLRQEPEVVVALDGVAGVAVADPDLDVEHLAARAPQLLQPAQPELGLRPQRRVPAGEVARRGQQQRVGVAAGVGELLVPAAGVEPAASHVHRAGDRGTCRAGCRCCRTSAPRTRRRAGRSGSRARGSAPSAPRRRRRARR